METGSNRLMIHMLHNVFINHGAIKDICFKTPRSGVEGSIPSLETLQNTLLKLEGFASEQHVLDGVFCEISAVTATGAGFGKPIDDQIIQSFYPASRRRRSSAIRNEVDLEESEERPDAISDHALA